MNFVTRFLATMVVEHIAAPQPLKVAAPAPSPYAQGGHLVCAPWEGLYIDEAA